MNKQICLNASVLAFMDSVLHPDSVVLEIGAGWSSRWFANRCATLFSVETDLHWAELVCADLEGSECAWEVIMPKDRDSLPRMLSGMVQPDLVLIDCREDWRDVATRAAWPLLHWNGWLLFDDAQRPAHRATIAWMGRKAGPGTRLEWQPGDVESAVERLTLAWQKC